MGSKYLWPTLNQLIELNPRFASDIKLYFVFGDGQEIIFVTNDDKVYGYGKNKGFCCSQNDEEPVEEPTKIQVLCRKRVIDIVSGYCYYPHVVALTQDGRVYGWGENNKGQCGVGSNVRIISEPTLVPLEESIQQVASGYFMTLALGLNGHVFSWGSNDSGQCGNGTVNDQKTPIKIPGLNDIISIACGASHSLALNKSGQVFAWGYNKKGQCGVGEDVILLTRVRIIKLASDDIKKIACGPNHSLLLAGDGTIYAFGDNKYGQLGDGTFDKKSTPTIINDCNAIKFIDVAASHHNNISVALREDGKCFVWGDCNENKFKEPKETEFTSMDDVYATFSRRKIMQKALQKTFIIHDPISDCIRKAFNDPEKSDFKIKVDGKYIHCHKFFLILRCHHFETMFSDNWDKEKENELVINQFSYRVYYAFIEYLYKDQVNVDADEALDLLDLANSYLEDDLKRRCVEVIKESISVENVTIIYSAAVKFNDDELRSFCVKFAHNKMNAILDTQAFQQMDNNLLKGFFLELKTFGAFI